MTTEIDKNSWYRLIERTKGQYVAPDDAGWLMRDKDTPNDNQLFCFVQGNPGLIAGKEIGPTGRPLVWTMEESRPGVSYVRLSSPPMDYNFSSTWFSLEYDPRRFKYWIHEPTKKEMVGIAPNGFLIRWEKDDGSTQLYTVDQVRKLTQEERKHIDSLIRHH